MDCYREIKPHYQTDGSSVVEWNRWHIYFVPLKTMTKIITGISLPDSRFYRFHFCADNMYCVNLPLLNIRLQISVNCMCFVSLFSPDASFNLFMFNFTSAFILIFCCLAFSLPACLPVSWWDKWFHLSEWLLQKHVCQIVASCLLGTLQPVSACFLLVLPVTSSCQTHSLIPCWICSWSTLWLNIFHNLLMWIWVPGIKWALKQNLTLHVPAVWLDA